MRIIVFVEDFGATGVVRNAIAIAGRLAEVGHDVMLLAAKSDGVLRASVPDTVVTASLNDPEENGGRKALMRRSFGRFRRFVVKQKPDIVVSSGNHGHLLVLGGTRFLRCRTIVRISNDLHHRRSGSGVGAWASLMRKLKYRMVLRLADRVVLVSGRLLDQVRALDPALARKAVVIPNGVDIEAVRSQSEAQLSDRSILDGPAPVLLAMGRLVPQKNFVTLLDAIARARETADVRLVVIGTGPLKGALLGAADRLGTVEAGRFVDPMFNPFPIMKRSAVMVLPSWWEGSSNVLLEALACGIPIVASRTAGNAEEILGNDRYGLLVDPGNAEEMAAAILKQIGSNAILPEDRAKAYDSKVTLTAYAALVAGMTPK